MSRALSATDRAYQETRTRILDGQLSGGDVITEGQIANLLGISRTPVREAFLKLQAEGMLQLYPKRGAVVVPVTLDEALPVAEANEVLESFAIEKILTEHAEAPPALVSALWDILAEMTRQVRARDMSGYFAADARFHLTLVDAAGNPFFSQFALTLMERKRRLQVAARPGASQLLESSYQEHVAIVEQLEGGDLDRTLALLRTHHRNGRALHLDPRQQARVG